MNKKLLVIIGLLSGVLSSWAQTPIFPAVERAVTRQALSVSALSRQANQAAYKQIAGIFRPLSLTKIQKPQAGLSYEMKRQVFQVQMGPAARSTASAFALDIDGRVWGVTAGHVMENIQLSPYMVVQNERGKLISAPITHHYTANTNGSDVAIFEIPHELRPYVAVLETAEESPAAQTVTQSPCYVRQNPLYLPAEDILFAGPHRILLRDQAHREMTGYCGSPVLANGKVIGLHVGAYSTQDVQLAKWNSLLGNISVQTPPALHIATPIEQAVLLARDFTKELGEQVGIPLKVFGHPVTVLTPREQLYSIQHLRNGFIQKTLHLHPFIHFDKLEEFFDLQEGDTLRVTIVSPKTMAQPRAITIYNVDVSTGRVTVNF